jgi:hypothetical protein
MNELSQSARHLIETVGNHDGPGPSDRERVRRTLLTALAGAGTTVAASAGATATAAQSALGSGAIAAGAGKVSATVALWLVGGGVAGFAVATPIAMYAADPPSISTSARPAKPSLAQRPAPPAVPATEPVAPPRAAEQEIRREVEAVPAAALPRKQTELDALPEPAKTAGPSVFAEVDLLKKAQRALSAGDGAAALALLNRHAGEFPRGAMVAERMAAQVFALCELGQIDEARLVAGAFLRAAPSSPLVPRVTASCAGSDAP